MDYEKELKEIAELLPTHLSDADLKRVEERELLKCDAIIYRADYYNNPLTGMKDKMCRCVCSACKDEWLAEYVPSMCLQGHDWLAWKNHEMAEVVGSNQSTLCPMCGAEVVSIHVSAFGNQKEKRLIYDYVMTVERVKEHIAVLTWEVSKYINKQGELSVCAHIWEGAVFLGKKLFRLAGHWKAMYGGISYFAKWQTRKRADFCDVEIPESGIMPVAPETVDGTEAECAALEFLPSLKSNFFIFDYIKLWKKYPTIENLIKNGFGELVCRAIKQTYGYYSSYSSNQFGEKRFLYFFDFTKSKPHEILGVEKSDLTVCKKMVPDEVKMLAFCRKRKIEYSKPIFTAVGRDIKAANEFFDTEINGKLLSPEKTMRYILKQKSSLLIFMDYIKMAKSLYEEIPESLIFPKDLKTAHDETARRITDKKNEELSEAILKRSKELNKLCFADEELGLMLTAPKSHHDFVFEGKSLDHCVASYAQDHASGKTAILFVREIEAPDTPFFTLEWKNGKINQNHGYKNCSQTEEVLEFEKRWLNYLKRANKNERIKPVAKQQACT